ncbi:hypothetical protein MKW94_012345, partial [Papaver nudicaule]|nr:hypothetical protein [Papaver nudicaule]
MGNSLFKLQQICYRRLHSKNNRSQNSAVADNTCYKEGTPMINSIPHEILGEILANVASSSLVDHLNANQTCKLFNEAGQDEFILRHASIDKLPVIQWTPKREVASFLKRCEHAQNPEILYRQGMV